MINFEEEIKKFHPSLEIEEAEDAIYNNNISDITDVMIQMVEELKGDKSKAKDGCINDMLQLWKCLN